MSYKFGTRSKKNLSECHSLIQDLCNEVIKIYDFAVIEGHRPQEEQDKAFHQKKSKLQWPNSKHNRTPSIAFDALPAPYDWDDKEAMYYFAGIVKGVAHSMGIEIRWGGDWDSDNDLKDQSFMDLVHFELMEVDE